MTHTLTDLTTGESVSGIPESLAQELLLRHGLDYDPCEDDIVSGLWYHLLAYARAVRDQDTDRQAGLEDIVQYRVRPTNRKDAL